MMKNFNKTLLAIAVTLASSQAMAAGFQLNSQSATGLGRAFAGDAVIADNASAMARNPAAMALFDTTSISVGMTYINTDVTLSDAQYSLAPMGSSNPQAIPDVSDIGGASLVPNIFIVHPLNDKWAVGFGTYSNFGTTTEYPDDFAAELFGGTTKVRSVNIQASVSYRINEQFSLGAGIDVIKGSGNLQREFMGNTILDVDAEGYGIGWHVGAIYEVNENHRFGLSYRYSPTIKAEGDFQYLGQSAADDTLHLPLPAMAEFSGFHQLTNQFALHYSAQFIQWSAFETLDTDEFGTIKEYNWRDTWHLSLGGTYTINDTWTARAGYMYDMGAIDQIKSIAIPDSDRQWFSAGLTYSLNKHSDIDLGITYLMGEDVNVTETQYLPPSDMPFVAQINGTTRANAWLYGIQYSYKF
ncbi:OmpP1/FadL family transporter [Shewanella benthica]|uniref:Putative long-chain fatty acid transport protein n=1 Tax=Shewanella benthica KT99 TaxID=314608 RepID=A9DDS2_9GAMM|nr:OmpP1/FadL family transporter [Shewanella benthica]EDQ00161.1 putative long-chain fatty acid transport protein [Shewanella benthica KT99]